MLTPAMLASTDRNLRKSFSKCLGGRVSDIRCMTEAELDTAGLIEWSHQPVIVVVLDNGAGLVLAQDGEGNGPGHAMEVEFAPIGGADPAATTPSQKLALELVEAVTILQLSEKAVTPSVLSIRKAREIVSSVMNRLAN